MRRSLMGMVVLIACATAILLTVPAPQQRTATSEQPGQACSKWVTLRHGDDEVEGRNEGDVWLTEIGAADRQLTHDGSLKFQPQLSPDETRVAFAAYDAESRVAADGGAAVRQEKIRIIDLSGQALRDIEVVNLDKPPQHCNAIDELEWIDEQRVGVSCHVDPDNEDYIVLEADTGKRLATYAVMCCWLEWSPDSRKVAYLGYVPHIIPAGQKSFRLEINGKEVFPLHRRHGEIHRFLGYPVWSPDSRQIAFVDQVIPRSALYVAVAGEGRAPLMATAPFEVDEADDVELSWEDGDTLDVRVGDDLWQLDATTGEWAAPRSDVTIARASSPDNVTRLTAFRPIELHR